MRLTDEIVRNLKPAAGKTDAIFFDDRRPGLGVRVRQGTTGLRRSWIVQLRVAGVSQRHDLGPASATTTTRARELADDIFGKVRQGGNPKAEKRAARVMAAESFETVAAAFLKEKKKELRSRSYAAAAYHVEKQLASLDRLPIHNVDRKTVADALSKIAERSGPVSANRARSTLSALFSWAIGEGLAENNPVVGTTKRKESSRVRALKGGELAAVWSACTDDDYGLIIRLLILTGQRRDEVGGMAETELLRDLRMWSLPGERTKNGLPHDVPLSDAALKLLPAVRANRDLLFGRGAGSFSGWSRCKERLDQRISESLGGKALAHWTVHDLRRSTATGMADIGVQPHIIEAVLNHVSGARRGVAGVYNKAQYAAEKRDALDRWGAHMAKVVSGRTANVVALRPAVLA